MKKKCEAVVHRDLIFGPADGDPFGLVKNPLIAFWFLFKTGTDVLWQTIVNRGFGIVKDRHERNRKFVKEIPIPIFVHKNLPLVSDCCSIRV